jgi:hypothetical protein
MKHLLIIMALLPSFSCLAQGKQYDQWSKKADSLLELHHYGKAADAFSKAFQSIGWKAYAADRYKAARAWSQAHMPDSAFGQLTKLAKRSKYDDPVQLEKDPDFHFLHSDSRWHDLLAIVNENKAKVDIIRNNPIARQLERIHDEDQKYRATSDWKQVARADSLNQIEVIRILDTLGWLGEEQIGLKANSALFLVIQHAELSTQQKYLPMMQKAVNERKARPSDLALLEDRVLMRQKKKQLYGSQLMKGETGGWIIYPIEDANNVDVRRAKVGLEPIAEYAGHFGLTWNLEEHIKQSKER